MKTTATAPDTDPLPQVSKWQMPGFFAYSRSLLHRRFNAIRVLQTSCYADSLQRPVVVYLNHASWWDPLVCLLLARQHFPGRTSYAPIAAPMLQRYSFFDRLGFFGVELGTTRGALGFLHRSQTILSAPGSALWLTPQGRFVDVRERPVGLQKGLGALAVRAPHALYVPLAIEYSFWTESRPEILVGFGSPILPEDESPQTAGGWTQQFAAALESTQDVLAAAARQRDPTQWQVLERGATGIGFMYDAWRRMRSLTRGQPYEPGHCQEVRS